MNEILVGADESEASLAAVEWAARAARARNRPLRVVHVAAPWMPAPPPDPRIGELRGRGHGGVQELLDTAAARADAVAPGLRVTAEQVRGEPARELLARAHGAHLVVVGAMGAGHVLGALLGSVALQLASHAPCPVVAVRPGDPGRHGEILVGVDGSQNSVRAVGFAFEEAALRGARLHALLAWTAPSPAPLGPVEPAVGGPLLFDPEKVAAEEERTLAENLAGYRERFPDVETAPEAVHEFPRRALAGASARADLLVLGRRGRGGFEGLVLGSVSHSMLHQAHCSVAVVPPDAG